MNLDWITVVGTLAALCSTLSFAPQAWKVVVSRHTADISARMYVLTVTGFALWTAYGIALGKWPLIAANSICLLLSGFILTMKLLPQRKKDAVSETIEKAIEP
ncbi:MAG: hypothetical protein GC166_08290 [Alphaproteobacteria bacterium]|nr:hypothetical protein [Alphaproteobacteria bacterium]